jgi:hypothetical protein
VLCSVVVSRLATSGTAMKPRAPVARDIRLYCLACAGIEVASHDPSWNSTNGLSPRGHFFG